MTLRVYEIRGKPSQYANFYVRPEATDEQKLTSFDATPKPEPWSPPPVYRLHPDRERWDIASFLGPGGIVVTERAYEVIRGGLPGGTVQILPFTVEGERMYVLNVLQAPDCLDQDRCIRSWTGSIESYVFQPERLPAGLFKMPDEPRSHVLVAEDDNRPDWNLKRLIEDAGLEGIRFNPLWQSE